MLFVISASAQKKKSRQPEGKADMIDVFLHHIDSTHDLNIEHINRVINYGYHRFIVHAEWKISTSTTREEMAYWEWFAGYVQIMSRKKLEEGFLHQVRALEMTRDSGEFRCKILEMKAVYYDYSVELDKELTVLDEINRLKMKNNGKPEFWVYVKKANILQHLKRNHEALDNYGKAIETGCSDSILLAEAYYRRGLLRIAVTSDSDGVMSDLETATRLNDNEPKYLYEHARLCVQWYGSVPEYRAKAEKDCERILETDTIATLTSVRHCALAMLGRKFEAERWIDRLMANFGENQNNWVYIYYNKAYIYAIMNDIPQAIAYLTEAEMYGGISCEKLMEDANFYNLHGTDEFEELMLRVCME